MMRRLVEPTRTRARLFDTRGEILADSRVLRGPGDTVQVHELSAPKPAGPVMRVADLAYDWIVDKLPRRPRYPFYRESASPRADDYPEVMQALRGEIGSAIRADPSSVGLVTQRRHSGPALQAGARRGHAIDRQAARSRKKLRTVRLELLRIFGVALLVTVLALALPRRHDRPADPPPR